MPETKKDKKSVDKDASVFDLKKVFGSSVFTLFRWDVKFIYNEISLIVTLCLEIDISEQKLEISLFI